MCGIFGVSLSSEAGWRPSLFQSVTEELFRLSESRGKEASGLALSIRDEIAVIKRDLPARRMIRSADYKKLFENGFSQLQTGRNGFLQGPVTVIGHSRLETDGASSVHENNQPVIKRGVGIVHNGIIVNHKKLWEQFPGLAREWEVDTEILPALIDWYYRGECSLAEAVQRTYQQIEGVASIAGLFEDSNCLLLATNNGSLYAALHPEKKALLFASERAMLTSLARKFSKFQSYTIEPLKAGSAFIFDPDRALLNRFRLEGEIAPKEGGQRGDRFKTIKDVTLERRVFRKVSLFNLSGHPAKKSLLQDNSEAVRRLRRCVKCVLPETFPLIHFDEAGVCSVCRTFSPVKYKGIEALEKLAAPHRKTNGEPDCIVAVSGGRDSLFALHYLKAELGMKPVAYTYDWGMVTDLARRNISRISSRLGVEHILISADIEKKRRFIRQNVSAWLKRPRLGTVPLFMAGDKQFFYYANVLQEQMGIRLVFFAMNPLERTDFKVAFCGIRERIKPERYYHLSAYHKLQLVFYYGKEFFLNPAYLNSSLRDTLSAFASYYCIRQNFRLFYDYFPWNEETILKTLEGRYGWERADDTPTTWRIGDGTASFYNYIYYTVAGFTENDTFRSNQVRQGLIGREEALQKVYGENLPRHESIRWYCDTNGIDFDSAIFTINQIPKLYETP